MKLLPPNTERLWNFLKVQPSLRGFLLLGGSALSLHIHHRLSEDLDFAFLAETLPNLQPLLKTATQSGFEFAPNDNPAALEDFASGGMNLRDYQQDYLVNAEVKVSFFVPEGDVRRLLEGSVDSALRVASLDEIFRTKSLLSARRSKSRDWFDLYILMKNHGFTLSDYYQVFQLAGRERDIDNGLARLCSGSPQRDDEGFENLLKAAPPIQTLKDFFIAQRNQFEIATASQKLRDRAKSRSPNGDHASR